MAKDLEGEEKLLETLRLLDENDEEELPEEERERKREEKKREFVLAFEKEVEKIKNCVEQTASYYQTDTKTKARIFLIYIGLAVVLGICSYKSCSMLPPLE